MKSKKEQAQELGIAIQRQRKSLGLTQDQLGRFAGCGVAFIYTLEHGKASVRLDKLLDVLEVLGLQLHLRPGKQALAFENIKVS